MKKISLKDVKNGLKRSEMRLIVGGCCFRIGGSTYNGANTTSYNYLCTGSGSYNCTSC